MSVGSDHYAMAHGSLSPTEMFFVRDFPLPSQSSSFLAQIHRTILYISVLLYSAFVYQTPKITLKAYLEYIN